MLDAHVHLSFMENGEEVAYDAAVDGCGLFAQTVTPAEFIEARERFAAFGNVELGLGLHPWWVQHDADASALVSLIGETNLIGEVGLDFGKRHAATREAQLAAFSHIARACAERGGMLLSIHSVHAAREALDVLEETGALETCTCVFHWFTGPSDQLKRAIDAGCFFSVGTRALVTKKGREYTRIIPASRLLLESDAPPEQGQAYSYAQLRAQLRETAEGLRDIKGEPLPWLQVDSIRSLA